MKGMRKGWLVVALLLAGGAAGTWWYVSRGEAATVSFRVSAIHRGDLLVGISATGTVEPEEAIDVGAQVAGKIVAFGTDADGQPVDYVSRVQEGAVLARIDDVLYKADVDQAQAQVESARAGVLRAEADVLSAKAKLGQAQADWARAEKLGPSDALAQSAYDGYKSAFEIAKANVSVSEAALAQAHAARKIADNSLDRANRNLGYCTITAPVSGVVIDRRVNVGQTVVASLNAPSLFLIAKDLKRMQVWVAVNEADVDSIYIGQPVTFTVEGLPGDPVTFVGKVRKVRYNAAMTQNVVTYTVEVETDNWAGLLKPYRTANVQFEVHRCAAVLLVSNAALRFSPSADQVAPQFRDKLDEYTGSRSSSGGKHATSRPNLATTRPGHDGGPTSRPGAQMTPGVVWVQDGTFVRPIRVRVGLTDGVNTQIEGRDLSEGMEVVTGVQSADAGGQTATNPFLPKMPSRRGQASSSPSPTGSGSSGSNRGGSAPAGPPPM